MKRLLFLVGLIFLLSCADEHGPSEHQIEIPSITEDEIVAPATIDSIAILVLGTCQDGGSPHAGCEKDCCKDLFLNPDPERMVVSLGVIDPFLQERYMFEATPDLPRQMAFLEHSTNFGFDEAPNGIFLTHAHIGHYAGLIHLGREAMNAKDVPVYVMPKMKTFLENNGPWEQLVSIDNIELIPIEGGLETEVNEHLAVTPFLVPHRDEYSETVGFKIQGPNKSAIFIPDIDKWEKWEKDIILEIQSVDYAFLDATFYDENELKNRNMSEIPHPFVVESMEKFADLPKTEKNKIIFIHLNHTNPLLDNQSEAYQYVLDKGFKIAKKGDVFHL